MAAPNLTNLTTITGKLQPYAVTTSLASTGLSVGTGKLCRVNTIFASNVVGTAAAKLSVTVYRGSTHTYIVKNVSIPAEASVVVLGKADGGLNLEESDVIYAQASAGTAIELLISYDELA
jgi:hypothetical protein